MSKMETIRVLLVDGNAFFRRGVRTVLEAEPELDVVGEASGGREALEQVGALSPDVVICDAKLGDMAGLEFTRRARLSLPSIAVVLLTATDDEDLLFQAIRSGVSAYIVEGIQAQRLKPILDVAMARFDSEQTLRSELQVREAQLNERKRIEQAKGLLMKIRHCDEEEAYTLMRRQAMDRQQKLIQVAEQIIAMQSLMRG